MERKKPFNPKLSELEKTKVIVRKFDMPTRSILPLLPGVRYPGDIQSQKEKISYLYTISNGQNKLNHYSKSQVTRVYPGRKSKGAKLASCATLQPPLEQISLSVNQEISDSKVILNSQSTCRRNDNKDLPCSIPELPQKCVPSQPVEENPQIVFPIGHIRKVALNDKLPLGVGNAVQLVETKLVNGKKMLILKSLKDISKTTSMLSPLKADSVSSPVHLDKESQVFPTNQQLPVIQCGSLIGSGGTQISNGIVVTSLNITPNKSNNLLSGSVNFPDPSKHNQEHSFQTTVGNADISSLTKMGSVDQQKQVVETCINAPIVIFDKPLNSDETGVVLEPNNSHSGMLCVNDKSFKPYVILDSKDANIPKNNKTVCLKIMHEGDGRINTEDVSSLASNPCVLKTLLTDCHSTATNTSALKRKLVPTNCSTLDAQQIVKESSSEKLIKLASPVVNLQTIENHNSESLCKKAPATLNKNQVCINFSSPVHIQSDTSINNCANSSQNIDSNVKQNNEELLRKREQIALQFQQEALQTTAISRNIKTLHLPARTVEVVDASVQTPLYSLFEPGRFVEMHFTKETSKGGKSSEYSNIDHDPLIGKRQYYSKKGDIPRSEDNNSMLCLKENVREKMDSVSSKRMRIDLGDEKFSIFSNDLVKNFNIPLPGQTDTVDGPINQTMSNPIDGLVTDKEISSNGFDKITTVCNKIMGHLYNIDNQDLIKKKVVARIFKDYKESIIKDNDGNLPIHNAVLDKDSKKVKLQLHILKAQKRSFDEKNTLQETPLHLAILCGASDIVEDLLDWGADLTIPDSHGDTALHMAVAWGNEDMFKVIMNKVEEFSDVLNKPNDDGYSPLHLCALKNKQNEALMLIRKGADINLRDRKSGRTPLFHAVESGHTVLSRTLIDLGASTTIHNFSGHTPLNASEVNLAVPGSEKAGEEELNATLCQKVGEFGVGKSISSVKKIVSVQRITNFDILGSEVIKSSELSLRMLNGSVETSQNTTKSKPIFLASNNR